MLHKSIGLALSLIAVTSSARQEPLLEHVHAYHRNKAELEKIDQKMLMQLISKLSHKNKKQLALADVLMLHQIIYKGISSADAGKLRTRGVRINGMIPPHPSQVNGLMNQLLNWLKSTKEHPLRVGLDAHLKLVDIHPFRDGNGRTARSMLAILLLMNGYPAPTFQLSERKAYCKAINHALRTHNKQLYNQIILKAIRKSFMDLRGKF